MNAAASVRKLQCFIFTQSLIDKVYIDCTITYTFVHVLILTAGQTSPGRQSHPQLDLQHRAV